MIKILGLIPGLRDATSFYRGLGPWQALAKKYPKQIQFDYIEADSMLDWTEIYNYDLFFGQRLYSDDHCTNILSIRKMGKPIWVDYDDNLFDVPDDNPTYKFYMTAQVKKNLRFIINNSDIVTTSTLELLKEILNNTDTLLMSKFFVIPNALHDEFPLTLPETNVKTRNILWRGSLTHENDLYQYRNEISRIAIGDCQLTFFGSKHHFIKAEIPDAIFVDPKPLIYYFEFLQSRQWAISIVPLVDNIFNRCKSNINWIESTYAGAVTLAPDWPEWNKPGVVNYTSKEDFYIKLFGMLNSPIMLADKYQESKNYINENLLLTKVNEKRVTILKKLFPNVEN